MIRIVVTAGAVLAFALIALAGRDFFALDRRIPPLAAQESRATSIVVEKQARRMTLLRDGDRLKTYEVSLGANPRGHKQQEGDGRTPEGAYTIDFKNDRSRFHLALRVSYPNASDRESAVRRTVRPGSDIMIHGLPNGLGWLGSLHLRRDWTDGCIAVTDTDIEEIWGMVDVGTIVEIRP